MRTRMYGGVRGRKTKVGGKPTFVFLLLDYPQSPLATAPRGMPSPFGRRASSLLRCLRHLADASDAALARLINTLFIFCYLCVFYK